MPSFAYIALDAAGAEKKGLLDAADAHEVAARLRERGLFPTDVTPAGRAVLEPGPAGRQSWLAAIPLSRPVGARELAVFTRQLGTLLKAGMPLLQALEALGRQQRNERFRHVVESLADGIRTGDTLSVAMGRHPRVFDHLFLSMIKAGEAGGVLDTVLDRLARFQEKSLHVRGKVVAAMVYPAVVLGVAAAILAGLLVFVVPRFEQIFADLLKGAPLPPLTRAVLGVSETVRQHAWLVAGLLVAGWIAFRLFRRTAGGALVVDTLVVKLPLFGDLFLKAVIARFGRTFGTLLSSGVPILPALLITRDTCGNARVAGAIQRVHDRVKEGAPVARPLEATKVFPPMVTSMIDVGEHSGQLPEMLNKVAEIYEDEVDNAVAGLSSLIEPILILFLALVVGTIVVALFLPIIRIVQLLT
jgi:type IV pilus assembly protein PilC